MRPISASLLPLLPCLIGVLFCSCRPIEQTPPRARHFPQQNGFGQPTNVGLARIDGEAIVPLTAPPQTQASSVIVVDLNTSKVLYAKNADQRRAVASTQKIITALCVLDAGSLDKPVRIVTSDGDCEPTKLGIRAGEIYTRRALLKVLLVKSANDVARALARDVAGSEANFAILMNRKCAQLGMRNSRFRNPHGLTEPGQYSTARDMAIAAMEAYKHPFIRDCVATKVTTFRFSDGRTIQLETTNKVLKDLPYCNGMKTGTTNASGRCLIATGSLRDRDAVAVVLHSNSRSIWNDSSSLLRWALERPQP